VSGRAALLYNIALVHRRAGHLELERDTLERFLAAEPTTPDRAEIEERLRELEPAKTIAVAPAPAPRTSFWRRPRLYTWIAGGAGVALLVGALGAGLYSKSQLDDLDRRCPGGVCSPIAFPGAAGEISSGRSAAIAADVLAGLGAGALAASVVLLFVEGRHGRARAAIAPAPGGVEVRF
jgi:hypothetical protein